MIRSRTVIENSETSRVPVWRDAEVPPESLRGAREAKTSWRRWPLFGLFLLACLLLARPSAAAPASASGSNWPRVHVNGDRTVKVHRPQVDEWRDFSAVSLHAAIEVVPGKGAAPRRGIVDVRAVTDVDMETRTAVLTDCRFTFRFKDVSGGEAARLESMAIAALSEPGALVIPLNLLLPFADSSKGIQPDVPVGLEPPVIFFSTRPATLLTFFGPPEFKPVGTGSLMAAVNTDGTVLLDTADNRYYLLLGESWLATRDLRNGAWAQPEALPPAFATLHGDPWKRIKSVSVARRLTTVPVVFTCEAPSELVVTDGDPLYSPIDGTRLMFVRNTEAALFLHTGEQRHYLLVAGRWFRAASLEGPWEAATSSLPGDFAKIPADHPMGYVLASVSGTDAAREAVVMASLPRKATVKRADLHFEAVYAGKPNFEPIVGTELAYVTNSPHQVIVYRNTCYAVERGVWFVSASPAGPWVVCVDVPAEIHRIPPTHPAHNVTYVRVYGATPTTVVVGYTGGYTGYYVSRGVVMFGAGLAVGYALADVHYNYWVCAPFHRPYPVAYFSYGYGAVYRPAGGGYVAVGRVSGPYATAVGVAAYNPATGAWVAGGVAAGPRGIVHGVHAYNPATGGYASHIGGGGVYGSWGRSHVERGDQWVSGGHRSGPHGNTGWVRTSGGNGAVVHNGNAYARKDGQVYHRTGPGEWEPVSGRGNQPDAGKAGEGRTAQSATVKRKGVEKQPPGTSPPSGGTKEKQGTTKTASGKRGTGAKPEVASGRTAARDGSPASRTSARKALAESKAPYGTGDARTGNGRARDDGGRPSIREGSGVSGERRASMTRGDAGSVRGSRGAHSERPALGRAGSSASEAAAGAQNTGRRRDALRGRGRLPAGGGAVGTPAIAPAGGGRFGAGRGLSLGN